MNQIVIHDAEQQQWLKFTQPVKVISTNSITEVFSQLELVSQLVKQEQLYGVGFISYEAAAGFDEILVTQELADLPLLWFGLYQQPEKIVLPVASSSAEFNLHWLPTVTKTEYELAIAKIKQYIRYGDTYQVNYTMRLQADFAGNPWDYFLYLAQAQQANYGAYLDLPDFTICSASPELFFRWDGNQIVTRPMKGTAARGYTLQSDLKLAQWLQNSPKNRAENVMIVDMIRNDLARVARLNSVAVPSLFDVEQYPTLWQMTSTVTAQTEASFPKIMQALFPCASITGAPKPRTMEIIRQLETTPRGIYTGTIGYLTPDKQAQFNVAIRTVLIDKQANKAEYGVGGGIVWDSASASEYEECQVKARVLLNKKQNFALLETILWTPQGGYFLLDYHLQRLADSAKYFNFKLDLLQVEKELFTVANRLQDRSYKVRLIMSREGAIKIETIPFVPNKPGKVINLRIAQQPIKKNNIFLYHKTTQRDIYTQIKESHPDCDDVLLWNQQGEITETSIANLVFKKGDRLLTPPVSSGLLAGTFRAYLLAKKEITEAIIKLADLTDCDGIYVINSVRKWQPGRLLR